jgi:hypothetical protein
MWEKNYRGQNMGCGWKRKRKGKRQNLDEVGGIIN